MNPVLSVHDLTVSLAGRGGRSTVVDGLSYSIGRGELLAMVGESGAGKTMSCRAVVGLLPGSATAEGSVQLDGQELLGLSERSMRRRRGADIGMVLQNSSRALNPTMPIGLQVAHAARRAGLGRRDAKQRALELLHAVRLTTPARLFHEFPHRLSGGMLQRVGIAIAIAGSPRVLFADEVTTALDVATRAEIMELFADLRADLGMALVLVSHDRDLVAGYADDIVVVANGREASAAPERASHAEIRQRKNPHGGPRMPEACEVLLQVRGLAQQFASRTGPARDVISDISFEIWKGETLTLVGESGAGKSTLARTLLLEPRPSAGSVLLRGQDLGTLDVADLRTRRRDLQLVHQDPFGSVDPKWKVATIIGEPLRAHREGSRRARQTRVAELLHLVGLAPADYQDRRPHELSGGQLQRVSIARALALSPALLVLDEPVSSLDAAAQDEITDLLERLQQQLGLAYLLIAHQLQTVEAVSHRVAVMYRGRLCEIGPSNAFFAAPLHPYSAALVALSAARAPVSRAHREQLIRSHDAAELSPNGCRFVARCPHAKARCREAEPPLREVQPGRTVACHFPLTRTVAPRTQAPTHADLVRPNSSHLPTANIDIFGRLS